MMLAHVVAGTEVDTDKLDVWCTKLKIVYNVVLKGVLGAWYRLTCPLY